MPKPEAVSRSKTVLRAKGTPHAIDTKPKLLFVTPIVTFLAGHSQTDHYNNARRGLDRHGASPRHNFGD